MGDIAVGLVRVVLAQLLRQLRYISPLYLRYISTMSPLYLRYISAPSCCASSATSRASPGRGDIAEIQGR